MADYAAYARTNYFRVTDEEKYKELFKGLRCDNDNDSVQDFTKVENGITLHGFGANDTIVWVTPETREEDDRETDAKYFIRELRKILPEDEVFTYREINHTGLIEIEGYVIVASKNKEKAMTLRSFLESTVKEFLGPNVRTEYEG